ncbi:MAG: hypothetical protein F6J87_29815, partial [Spirulina sp. SIO3F2]|nr:hypothetical protein [Spirulina sp. SIO3F2]
MKLFPAIALTSVISLTPTLTAWGQTSPIPETIPPTNQPQPEAEPLPPLEDLLPGLRPTRHRRPPNSRRAQRRPWCAVCCSTRQ